MKRVLLVDDDPLVRRIGEVSLRALAKLDVVSVASGEEALVFLGRAKGGTGLGLAIARSIVELHGGAIGVEDGEPGATFWVELPRAGRPPPTG